MFRDARLEDLATIIAMLADDERGALREDPSLPLKDSYIEAFEAIDNSPMNHLIVGEIGFVVVACLQLTFTPGLSYQGGLRATIEEVRVASHLRGGGIGAKLIDHACMMARWRGCNLVQLTSNKARLDSHRFYKRLGFANSHEGFKLELAGR